jgi:glycosyltransferase involved in cell wall biosynthesis
VEISIILGTHNSEEYIGTYIKQALQCFKTLNLEGEVIISDYFSRDRTVEIALKHNLKVVYPTHMGHDLFSEGYRKSHGSFILFVDAKAHYNVPFQKFILPLIQNFADVVIGKRLINSAQLYHKFIIPAHRNWVRLMYKTQISDPTCGIKSVTRRILNKFNMETISFRTLLKKSQGLRILEIPVEYNPRLKFPRIQRDIIDFICFLRKNASGIKYSS